MMQRSLWLLSFIIPLEWLNIFSYVKTEVTRWPKNVDKVIIFSPKSAIFKKYYAYLEKISEKHWTCLQKSQRSFRQIWFNFNGSGFSGIKRKLVI